VTRSPGAAPDRGAPALPDQPLLEAVLRGLSGSPRRLSPALLYDAQGSFLFDRICELPEYYLTRTETQILARCAPGLAALLDGETWLVELGSGSCLKTRLLLDALPQLTAYVPVDISSSHLLATARELQAAYPHIAVLPLCADFTQPFELPRPLPPAARVLVFFPGSTVGNFDPPEAIALLAQVRRLAGRRCGLLIGFDMVKDVDLLERAYNDSAGVTAAFNLNVLERLNRELGARFDPGAFQHRAVWVSEASRIEMQLVSLRRQQVLIRDERLELQAGEPLITEHCHKYTPATFAALAVAAGWRPVRSWTDAQHRFQVQYLHGNNDP
jgi:dimethylhistidine N-methyltransferase